MESIDRRFDAVVIGSGPGGSMAVKELTERGMDVLLLEAGRDLTDEDFVPPAPKAPKQLGMDIDLRAKAMLGGQHRQARRTFFSETSNRFLVNDRENPYSTPRGAPYLWVRGRVLGGRLNTYGRVLQRMSDVDFKAASRDGHGIDWPFSYSDLEPWYDRVEEFIGVYGNEDGLAHPPDGRYIGPAMLTDVEQTFRDTVAERWPERKVIAWRYAAPHHGPADDPHRRRRHADHDGQQHGAGDRRGLHRPAHPTRAPGLRRRRRALRVDHRDAADPAELR
jgi:choline dehydrogenase-like flavoprotein